MCNVGLVLIPLRDVVHSSIQERWIVFPIQFTIGVFPCFLCFSLELQVSQCLMQWRVKIEL